MGTHNICFHVEIRKNVYLDNLSRAMEAMALSSFNMGNGE